MLLGTVTVILGWPLTSKGLISKPRGDMVKGESKLRQDFIKKEGRKTMIRKVKKRLR